MDYDKLLNGLATNLKPSGIRKYFDIAAEMDDVISLGVGEPDFPTPWHVRNAGIESLREGQTKYTANRGIMELRDEISKYLNRRFNLKYDPEKEVVVTVGGSEAIDASLRVMVAPGDEVLIPEPCFVCYSPLVTLCSGIPVPVQTDASSDFRLTAETLKKYITPKTKVLILPYPNNPTGAIMDKSDLESIAEVLRDTDIFVLSDEIYAELTYSGSHISIASIEGMRQRTVVINGFSKSYSMTGWRLGYACGPEEIIKHIVKIHQFAIMSAPTTAQVAAIEALRNGDSDIESMKDEYNMRRKLVVHGFNELGLTCFEPLGAFYTFPCIKSTGMTSDEFCERLLKEKHVAVIPGTAFGDCGEGYIRVSYCYSVKHLKTALQRISDFLEENKK